MDLLDYLLKQYPVLIYVIGGLGIVVSAYSGYVRLTKKKSDDAQWEKIKNHKIWGPLIRIVSKKREQPKAEEPEEKKE